jgi:hypothetical protein
MPQYLGHMDRFSLIRREEDGLVFYQFPLLQTVPGLRHGIFTRLGGDSSGELGP